MRSSAGILGWVLICLGVASCGVERSTGPDKAPVAWHDPSPHSVHFIAVDKDVKLEVLDWGGTGRPVVLLTGLGDTAHVYDDFALKLNPLYHVYGITRRGFGASSAPVPHENNYSADRLGDDVLAVLDALKIETPVLVGHSIAGEELSSIASRHPERVAGLVYLDAGYCYAYYDPSLGCVPIDGAEFQRKLMQVVDAGPAGDFQAAQKLLQSGLPLLQRDLRAVPELDFPKSPDPTPVDAASFPAFTAWFARTRGIAVPESELRATTTLAADGRPGGPKTPPSIPQAIWSGAQKYTHIRLPVLAIFAFPHEFAPFVQGDPAGRAAVKALDDVVAAPEQKAFQNGVPSARVVRLPHANHYVFLSNQADVLREMRTFINGLPQ
jgi:non-heme chloroperoxidase